MRQQEMETLLRVVDINTKFTVDRKEVNAVENVSFYLNPGEIIGVVGESGSGKSVTMMSVLQLIAKPGRVAGGEVYLGTDDDNLLDYGPKSPQVREIRGGKIGIIFQEPMTSLNPVLTVGYQIQETVMLHLGLDRAAARKKTIEMLKLVNIPDAESRFGYYPQQFSGGMRQRVMIAMALAAEPQILIADEATTALDVTTQAQLLEMMRDIAKATGTSIILVTHNLGVVARYAERIYVMYSGNIMETAGTLKLFNDPTHPYTRGLLRAIPRINEERGRMLIPIKGLPPRPSERPDYCLFYDRCSSRMDKCREKRPELREIGEGHFISCLLTDEERKLAEVSSAENERTLLPERVIGDEICLKVKDLSKFFTIRKGLIQKKIGEVKAIEDIGFDLRSGETLGIVGESGCGKTTLARCLMRVYKPDTGSIVFKGLELVGLRERPLRKIRPKIAMIFQDPFSSLDPRQTAGSIVGESLKLHKLVDKDGYDDRIDELFRIVGLNPAMKDRVPHEFSGGQRQRLGIARALSSNPDLIVCDEPTSALDVSVQAQILNLLQELQQRLGVTYLFIAHDLAVVRHISDRIMVMYLGRVVEIADCDDIYNRVLHPYTKLLLSAIPTVDPEAESRKKVNVIKGEVPSLLNRPEGCPFSDRCENVMERCKKEIPELKEVEERHKVACHLY